MKDKLKRTAALLTVLFVILTQLSASIAAGWITVENDLRSPLKAERADINITNVSKRISNVCYDLQCEYPTSLYQVTANGVRHDALCVAAKRTTPGDGGKVYKLDLSGLKSCKGESSRLLEASANLTEADAGYSVWWNAYRYSELANYNDEQIMRKIAWLIDDGNWTYYPLKHEYSASDLYSGIELDFDHPITDPKIYRDLVISTDAQARYKAFDIPSSRVGAKISGLYGAAHAIASRVISGDRYHLSGTIYYSFTRTDSDKATYTKGSHSAFAYGDDGNGNDNNKYRRIQLMQYFNIIAHAPEYKGDLYIYSPDKRSGGGQQWLLFADKHTEKYVYVKPAVDKRSPSGDIMSGAEFTVYEDSECSKAAGVIKDNNGDGDYSDYVNKLTGDAQKDGLILLDNNDGTFAKTVYLKETKAPVSVASGDGDRLLLKEEIIDDNVYKVSLEYGCDSGDLKVVISTSGKKVYSKTYKDYDPSGSSVKVKLANNSDGDFTDGAGLSILKESGNGYTVTNTVFELYKGADTDKQPLAYYLYKGKWSWFEDKNGNNEIGKVYPLIPSSQYTLVEEYTEDKYKDTDISYDVVNRSEWTKIGHNRYMYSFSTEGISHGKTITVKAVNDRVTSSISVTKTSDDSKISGINFELYYLGNGDTREPVEGIYIDTFKTDKKGKGTIGDLPLGWYRVRELTEDDYVLAWGEGTVTDGNDAIVHLTDSEAGVSLTADNRLLVRIAVIKKDAENGEFIGGAGFRLYEDTDERKLIAESSDDDNDGICVFENISIGDYLLEESAAPSGYYLNKEVFKVNVKGKPDGKIIISGNEISAYQIEVGDRPYAAPVCIEKTASHDESIRLSGAVFDIYEDTNGSGRYEPDADKKASVQYEGKSYEVSFEEQNGRYISVIDAGGNKTANLRYGTYFVVETASPELYLLGEQVTKVTVPKKDKPVEGEEDPVVVKVTNELGFSTTLTGLAGTKIPEYGEKAVLTDTVAYTNLAAGRTYTLKGRLIAKDAEGNLIETGVESTKDFTVEDNGSGLEMSDGTVRVSNTVCVEFVIDTTRYKGMDLVAYESLYCGDRLIGKHEDINDAGQTVRVPEAETELTDKATGSHTVTEGRSSVLTDEVHYKGLVAGKEYTVTGVLIDKETGNELKDNDGKAVTSSVTFTAESEEGHVSLEFTVDTSYLSGRKIVAFETVSFEGRKVAVHADINDNDQTVGVPELVTSASGNGSSKLISNNRKVSITDKVEYKNLTPGRTYIVSGSVMYAGSGKQFLDPKGKSITSEVVFVPDRPDGSVNVVFDLDASGLKDGDKLVVYEDAYERLTDGSADTLICAHRDPENASQTVTVTDIPKTGSDISESEYIAGILALAGTVVSVTCLVYYIKKRKYEDH